jgi:hypothetical protein
MNQLTIPVGTRIRIRLAETLDTEYCRPGERFAAQLDEPIVIGRRVVAPAGASAGGHVTVSRPSGRFKGHAVLGLVLDSIRMDGNTYAISTNMTARASADGTRNAILRSSVAPPAAARPSER